jgi:hypothetical protein
MAVLQKCSKHGGQALPGAVKPGVNGGRREAEQFGELGDGVILQVVKDDEFAVAPAQGADGGLDLPGDGIRVVTRAVGVGLRAAPEGESLEEQGAGAAAALKNAAGVDGDAREPREKRTLRAEGAAMGKGVHEHLLQGVLGVRGVGPAQEAAGEALEFRAVKTHDGVKGVRFSERETSAQAGIFGRAGGA